MDAIVEAASGFHVLRIEGYSLTNRRSPAARRISSQNFTVGGRRWRVDLYPNGTDSSNDESDSIALFLVYDGEQAVYRNRVDDHEPLNRLRAQYRFCLLDHAGNAAYELPAEKGVFTSRSGGGRGDDNDRRGCGHDTFISWDELEARRERLLLKDDCLAIRCDVGVLDQLTLRSIAVGAKRSRSARDDTDTKSSSSSDDDTDSDDSRSRRRKKRRRRRRRRHQATWLDDREYVLRTLES
ncbi:LOW QUALITY PROTEIN: hypothetical protein BDA96_07G047600 [Sorghum bicolor]|uniref:MATH domain-containing protein n=2 Tax=Sorghum bicolor TaxID=4558 RepID=A0A921QIU6_SORBI|nr:LOW QUALITY PROTEIN: hypothetical protein BDA96_07G047600 [Sorghum bicolor]KXG24456.1 LOW QUALITY PROTEIN: hypothetical protein SORBI_3007G044700 [Sorghum bicolor]